MDALAGKDFGEAIGGAAVFPLAGAGGEMDVAGADLLVKPGIAHVREIIDGIVEIEIVVVQAVHEIADVVNAGHGEAALDDVGMLEERVGGVIGAEGCAHGGNGDAGALAIVPDEGNDLFAKVGIEDGLDIAAVKGMRAFVIEAEAVDGIDAEDFDFAALDKIGESADHALAFEFGFVAGAGGKTENGLSPMAMDDDAKVKPQAGRMPAVVFAFHKCASHGARGGKVCQPRRDGGNGIETGVGGHARCIFERAKIANGGSTHGNTKHDEPADTGTYFHGDERVPAYGGFENGDRTGRVLVDRQRARIRRLLLAGKTGAAERGLRILCDFLTIMGFLTKENGRYALTEESSLFLDRRSPACLCTVTGFLASPWHKKNVEALTAAVRKGGTAGAQGDNSKPQDEVWVAFARSMAPLTVPAANFIAGLIGAEEGKPCKVLDIAAGHGNYGITMAKKNPKAQIVAVDWPSVLAVAQENAQKAGVSERYTTRPGSAFETDLGSGYDFVLLTNIFHHFDQATCEKLMRRVHGALKTGGKARHARVCAERRPGDSASGGSV